MMMIGSVLLVELIYIILIVMMSIQLSSIFVRGAMRHWTFNGDLMRMMKTGNVQSAEPTLVS